MNLLIKGKRIQLEYLGRDILDIDEIELYAYDRIGLVGDNGAGKSSLLKILLGDLCLSSGEIQRFGECAYISQLESIAAEMICDREVLSRLGVANLKNDTKSGGEETRTKIAAALSEQMHIILADEPTSHLDRAGIELLIKQLRAFDGALLVVSHDRHFLDQVVDKIWELKDGKIKEYWGGYSEYRHQKELERKQKTAEYQRVMQEREAIEQAILEKRNQAAKMDNKKKGMKSLNLNESKGRLGHQKSIGSKQKKMHQAVKSMEKRKHILDQAELPEHSRKVQFRQSKALELHNRFPITAEGLNFKFDNRILFEDAGFAVPLGAKVAIVGDNGVGKTTLLKMIVKRAAGLTISPKAEMGYLDQNGYKFQGNQSVLAFMQEECDYSVSEIRGVLASMGIGPNDIQKQVNVLSGGEIMKLLMAKMLLGRYNILLMDEPGNYLDLKSMEALEEMMKGYTGTIIFVSHDKRLVDSVADTVFEICDRKIVKRK